MCRYFKYFSYCLFLGMGMLACTNEAAEKEPTNQLSQDETGQAQEIVQKGQEAEAKVANLTQENVEETEKPAEEIKPETEEPEEEVETKEERLKRERKERRARRKKRAEAKRKAAKKAPKIDFVKKSHSFGTIMQGDEVEHVFKFKNTGKSDLVISNVTVTCGCTQPSYPFIPIAPGEEGQIKIHYNSTGKLGPQKPTATVISNAIPSKHKIYLEGFVDAERAKPIEKTKKDSL